MIASVALATLIRTCAPSVDVRTAAAIVAVESGGREYAVRDNTTRRSYFPTSLADAQDLVRRLLGHQLDLGLAQVDTVNLPAFGVTPAQALDSCTSLRLGSQVLAEDYRQAYRQATGATEEERRQVALRRAFSAYNSGSPTAAPDYAALVVAATSSPLVREATAIADGRESGAVGRLAHRAAPKAVRAAPRRLRARNGLFRLRRRAIADLGFRLRRRGRPMKRQCVCVNWPGYAAPAPL